MGERPHVWQIESAIEFWWRLHRPPTAWVGWREEARRPTSLGTGIPQAAWGRVRSTDRSPWHGGRCLPLTEHDSEVPWGPSYQEMESEVREQLSWGRFFRGYKWGINNVEPRWTHSRLQSWIFKSKRKRDSFHHTQNAWYSQNPRTTAHWADLLLLRPIVGHMERQVNRKMQRRQLPKKPQRSLTQEVETEWYRAMLISPRSSFLIQWNHRPWFDRNRFQNSNSMRQNVRYAFRQILFRG